MFEKFSPCKLYNWFIDIFSRKFNICLYKNRKQKNKKMLYLISLLAPRGFIVQNNQRIVQTFSNFLRAFLWGPKQRHPYYNKLKEKIYIPSQWQLRNWYIKKFKFMKVNQRVSNEKIWEHNQEKNTLCDWSQFT